MDLETRLRVQPLPVRDVWTPEKTARLPREVLRRLRRRTMTRVALATSAAAGALMLLALRVATPSVAELAARQPLRTPAVAAPAPRVLTLHDGSRAELDGTSRLEVSSDRGEHVSLRLLEGAARFDVVPNHQRVFEVDSGAVRVRVIGTAFSMVRSGATTRVAVERGRVRVLWDDRQVELGAGEGGEFPPPPPAPVVSLDSLPLSVAAPEVEPEWRALARRGDYAQAFSALRRARTPVRQEPEELMLAADVARLSGNAAQAVPHLQAVVQRFPSDPRAPVAAFTLGRVYFDNLGKAAEAAAAFRRTRSSWPRGPLAQDAWAREVAAWQRAGRAAEAAATARHYLERHPKGPHAGTMRRLVE